MSESIFSRYTQGENHITSTLLAVLQQLSLHNMDNLISAMVGDSVTLVDFTNQPSAGHEGVPDAEISTNLKILIETKTVRNTVRRNQLDLHIDGITEARNQYLLVLTPDGKIPKEVTQLTDDLKTQNIRKKVAWTSFAHLSEFINTLISDSDNSVSEHERFILKQFDLLLQNKGLLEPESDTVIVAARDAWPVYLATGVYACQTGRSFRDVDYMGFYCERNIQPKLAKILSRTDNVELSPGKYDGDLGLAIDRLLAERPELNGNKQQVFLLSLPDSDDTETLDTAIVNVKRPNSDKLTAFTMGQRYVAMKHLEDAKNTNDVKNNQINKAA